MFLNFETNFSHLNFSFSNRWTSTRGCQLFFAIAHFLYKLNDEKHFHINNFFLKIISLTKIF